MKSNDYEPNISALWGLMSRANYISSETGEAYEEYQLLNRPEEGFTIIYSNEAKKHLRVLLKKIGLNNLADLIKFEIYKEKEDQSKNIYAPIYSNIVRVNLWLLRDTLTLADRLLSQCHDIDHENNSELQDQRDYINHILQFLSSTADGKLNYHIPRFVITDMRSQGLATRFPEVLHDLNPSELITSSGIPISELANEFWGPIIFNKQEMKLSDFVSLALTQELHKYVFRHIEHSWDNAVQYTEDGSYHEVVHFIAGYAPPKLEKVLLDIFMDAQGFYHMRENPLWYKNLFKATRSINNYRKTNNILEPTRETSTLAIWVFVNEMFCDYLAVDLKHRGGEEHFYSSKVGVIVPPALQQVFDIFMAEMIKLDSQKKILLFDENTEITSAFINTQKQIKST